MKISHECPGTDDMQESTRVSTTWENDIETYQPAWREQGISGLQNEVTLKGTGSQCQETEGASLFQWHCPVIFRGNTDHGLLCTKAPNLPCPRVLSTSNQGDTIFG